MSEIDFSGQVLTYEELLDKLDRLQRGGGRECVQLNLSNINLSEAPNLEDFNKLKVLHLGTNDLTWIYPEYLPQTVTKLDLSFNYLENAPDLSRHINLEELNLKSNRIKRIYVKHVPVSVTDINLSDNEITHFPDFQEKHFTKLNIANNRLGNINLSYIPDSVTEINLSGTQLNAVPDFSKCDQLKTIDLGNNGIAVVPVKYIPQSATDLNFSQNPLEEVPYFRYHQNLCKLNLGGTHIESLDAGHFPQQLSDLNLSGCKLFDLTDLSQLTNLSKLDVTYNPNLHSMQGLPHNCLDLKINSRIKELGLKCVHKENFHVLRNAVDAWGLKKPPPAVFNQGVEAIYIYYNEKHAKTTQSQLLLVGPTTAGKSSLLNSLIANRGVVANIDNRTQIAEIKSLDVSDVDTMQVYDQGGHEIYNITTPLFMTDNSLILLVHDIRKVSKGDLEETICFLHQTLQQYPKNHIHVVLTHSDLLDEVSAKENEIIIKKALERSIKKEISSMEQEQSYRENSSNKSLSDILAKQNENMRYFVISSETYAGIDALKQFLAEIAEDRREEVPEKWIGMYKKLKSQKKSFWKVDDVQTIFEGLYSSFGKWFKHSKILSQFTVALRYFKNAGQILFYEDVPGLNEYVFHEPYFIIDLLKACIHHNLTMALKSDSAFCHSFPGVEFKLMLSQYQQEGLLQKKLLNRLWQKQGLEDQDHNALFKLMILLKLCYPVDKDSEVWYFPWFVMNKCPANVNPDQITKIDKHHFAVQLNCIFHGRIPVNAFEMFLVQIQRTAVEKKYGGNRYTWHDGLLVEIDTLKCIAIRKQEQSMISLSISGPSQDLEGIWQVAGEVHSNLDRTLEVLKGVLKEIYFLCSHCLLKENDPIEKLHPKHVFKKDGLSISEVKCNGDQIPRGLVRAINDKSYVNRDIKNVEEYLNEHAPDVSLPNQLLYLDCNEVYDQQFELSWGWPACKNEGNAMLGSIDQSVTHAIIEVKNGEDWQEVCNRATLSPYTFEGPATEFRAAAVNEYGRGEFLCVTPMKLESPDEQMHDGDRQNLEINYESFCRMTNVSNIVVRLYSRKVINDALKESLMRLLRDNNSYMAADNLMENVRRMANKNLYLFQKTLRETGQEMLAENVPVRIRRTDV